jgi:hypothetical protein
MERSSIILIVFVAIVISIIATNVSFTGLSAIGNIQIQTILSIVFGGLFITALYFNPTSAIMIFFVYAIVMSVFYRRWQNSEGFINPRSGRKLMNVSST